VGTETANAITPLTDRQKEDPMKLDAIILGSSVSLAGVIVNVPAVRSRLRTATMRAVAAELLAAVIALGGVLIEHFVVDSR
jgi:hypothetical protein